MANECQFSSSEEEIVDRAFAFLSRLLRILRGKYGVQGIKSNSYYLGCYNKGNMKVLGIMGSPRKQSNTDILLDRALDGAREAGAEVEKVLISKLKISPCLEIYACLKDGNCAIRDDMDALYKKLLEADHVIFASPIFFYGVTSQAKAVIDRCQALWVRRHMLGMGKEDKRVRRGMFISVGATRGAKLFDGAVLTVKYFFQAMGVEYSGDLLVRGIDNKAQIEERLEALQDAFRLGQELVRGK
jgi:multimeric flavodoxin WrbA